MEKTVQLMKDFESRNNMSIVVTFYSNGSSSTEEFWRDENLARSKNIKELHEFLLNTHYQLAEDDGRCLSPVQII